MMEDMWAAQMVVQLDESLVALMVVQLVGTRVDYSVVGMVHALVG